MARARGEKVRELYSNRRRFERKSKNVEILLFEREAKSVEILVRTRPQKRGKFIQRPNQIFERRLNGKRIIVDTCQHYQLEDNVNTNPDNAHLLHDLHEHLMGMEASEIDSAYIVGSHAHGTYVPPHHPDAIDDIDITVIFVPNARHALGLERVDSRQVQDAPYDIAFHSIGKFVRMLLKSNPNALMLLFMPVDMMIQEGPALDTLKNHRDIFISQEMYEHFVGYAMSQIKGMEKNQFKGYMGDKRKKLVEQYGYDVKSAAHAIRVLYTGWHALSSGIVPTKLSPAKLGVIREIKSGRWQLEGVKELASSLLKDMKYLDYSHLPEHPDRERAEDILVQIQSEAIYSEVFREKTKGLDGMFIPRPHRTIGTNQEWYEWVERTKWNMDTGENSPDIDVSFKENENSQNIPASISIEEEIHTNEGEYQKFH